MRQNVEADVDRDEGIPQVKILIVDDQQFNINALIIILQHVVKIDPQIVFSAKSGRKALEILEANIAHNLETHGRKSCDFHLVFMDCNMPFMDGYETTQRIRQMIFSEQLPQPIISAVTGHTEQ